MPKYPENDKVTVTNATALSTIDAIATPATATAEDIATKVNEILAALKTNLE